MPEFVQQIMIAAPTTHFVKLAQGIIYRGGALDVVWPQFLALAFIGAALFGIAPIRFRKTIGPNGVTLYLTNIHLDHRAAGAKKEQKEPGGRCQHDRC